MPVPPLPHALRTPVISCNAAAAQYAHAAWPWEGTGPASHPGPDQLSMDEGVMRNRVTRRYFQQLFALYAGFVQSR